jgi:hypothetical protein
MENMKVGEFNPEAGTNMVIFEHDGCLFRFEVYTTEELNDEPGTLRRYCLQICNEIVDAFGNKHPSVKLYHDRVSGDICMERNKALGV